MPRQSSHQAPVPAKTPVNAVNLKSQERIRLRELRDALPGSVRQSKSEQACERAVKELAGFDCVAVYSAIRSELCPRRLVDCLRAAGVSIAYPRVSPHARELAFFTVRDDRDLAPGSLGILEPRAGLSALSLASIDALVIPGLAFDPQGQRLGGGQGHYDHTLAQCPSATRVGICFQEQVVASLPSEPTDVPMHVVLTDAMRYHVSSPKAGATREPS